MVSLFFRDPFFAHFVQPFSLKMLYKPLPRQFLLNFDGKLLIKFEFIEKNNALHIFLYRKFNAFHLIIVDQKIL